MDAGKSAGGDLDPVSPAYVFSGKIMLAAIVVMFIGLLLLLFLHLYLRWRTLSRSSALSSPRRHRPRRHFSFAAAYAAPRAAADDRRGLDPAVLKCFPSILFSPGEEDDEAAADECAVCISEFEQGEELRRLPQCGHRFHVECIDMWFRSHTTCPLCRSAVKAPAPAAQIAISADIPAFSTPDLRSALNPPEESAADPIEGELRIEVPVREWAVEGAGSRSGSESGSKSPGTTSRRLLLRRILSGDLILCRGGTGGGSLEETDLERGDVRSPPEGPPATSPATSPATVL